jgi:hypothetical protein
MPEASDETGRNEQLVLAEAIKSAVAVVAAMDNTGESARFTSETLEDIMGLLIAMAARDAAIDLYVCVAQLQYNAKFRAVCENVFTGLLGSAIANLESANEQLLEARSRMQLYLNAHKNTCLTRANIAMRKRTMELLSTLKVGLSKEDYDTALQILNNTQESQASRRFVI